MVCTLSKFVVFEETPSKVKMIYCTCLGYFGKWSNKTILITKVTKVTKVQDSNVTVLASFTDGFAGSFANTNDPLPTATAEGHAVASFPTAAIKNRL